LQNGQSTRLAQFLSNGQSTIFDAVNFTRQQRDEIRAIAEQYKAESLVIYIDVPEATARKRWQQNRDSHQRHDVRDDNFAQVIDNFQVPAKDEAIIRYDQYLPLDIWIERTFLQG
jgi:predicted kinase